jgi:hypothetical protein
MSGAPVTVQPVEQVKNGRKAFVDFAWEVYRDDPAWVPPLKDEVHGLLNPKKNPWFEHARAQLFLALRGERVVGRISAQVDELVLEHMGAGTGQWGMFEALDGEAAAELIGTAENWLRAQGMTRALGPFSLSIWDEPGLEIEGFAEAPTVMMGHHQPQYEGWVEAAGYRKAKDLLTYEVNITHWDDPLINRLIAAGERNPKIRIRKVDKSRFYEELVRVAEYDGQAVAFMITIPDMNELIRDLDGKLFPFGWAKLLWRLRHPKTRRARVPLMGVAKKLHHTRLASQLAFMLIEFTRRDVVRNFGVTIGEFGWILEDNKGMLSIAELPGARVNHRYRIYEKGL